MGSKEKDINIPEMSFEEIDSIVSKGVKPKISFISYLSNSFREIGFRNIFHDKTELAIIFLIGIAMLLTFMVNFNDSNIKGLYKLTFVASPIFYLVAVLFSFYNSKEKGAFDIEMTCKYNLYQLSAIRMFIFSLACIIVNTISVIITWLVGRQVDVIRMIVISITGVFLFSIIFLYSLLKLKFTISKYLVVSAWIGINLFLSNSNNEAYQEFLIKAPLLIHLIISSICIVLYIKNLNKLINYRHKKGEI